VNESIERILRSGPDGGGVGESVSRFAAAAEAAGLVDVAYVRAGTPFGDVLMAGTSKGLVRIGFLHTSSEEELLREIAVSVSPRVLHAPGRLDEARRQLDEYFEGRRRTFELATDRRLIRGFAREVLAHTARIPYGSFLTYGEVAAEAGKPRAHRAAGTALARNPIPIVIPCHRVLRSGGVIGNYGGGPEMKARLLALEGARVASA